MTSDIVIIGLALVIGFNAVLLVFLCCAMIIERAEKKWNQHVDQAMGLVGDERWPDGIPAEDRPDWGTR